MSVTGQILRGFRERIAYKIAPWVYVPYREEREQAFKDLAEVAYLSRDAIWTSPRVLVKTALANSKSSKPQLDMKRYDPGIGGVDCCRCGESILCIIGGPPKSWKWPEDGWLCPDCSEAAR